jgi:hypothetical protein
MVRTRRPVHILIRAGATSLTPDCVLRQAVLMRRFWATGASRQSVCGPAKTRGTCGIQTTS